MRDNDIRVNEKRSARRKARDRLGTEARLLKAARMILQRDGVLAGLRLQEVAQVAEVNRGQIYQYFGNRQGLLRAAIASIIQGKLEHADRYWELPFVERRLAMFKMALEQPEFISYEALLALDRDGDVDIFPYLQETKQALEKDMDEGHLPEDADGLAAHMMTAATYMGYVVFRELIARSTGVDVEELDKRAVIAYEKMARGLTVADE